MKSISYIHGALLLLAVTILSSPAFAGRWQKFQASYEVPAPKELAAYANLEVRDLRVRNDNGVLQLTYTLPLELTGVEVRIVAKSNDQGRTFKGYGAYLECGIDFKECQVVYPGLKIDKVAVKVYLEAQGIRSPELEARLKVVDHFTGLAPSESPLSDVSGFLAGGDPHGILHIKSK